MRQANKGPEREDMAPSEVETDRETEEGNQRDSAERKSSDVCPLRPAFPQQGVGLGQFGVTTPAVHCRQSQGREHIIVLPATSWLRYVLILASDLAFYVL